MHRNKLIMIFGANLCLSNLISQANAQQNNQQLEKMLDSVDQSSPVSAPARIQNSNQFQSAPSNLQTGEVRGSTPNSQNSDDLQVQQGEVIQNLRQSNATPTASPLLRALKFFNGNGQRKQARQAQQAIPEPFNIFQTMFGAGSGGDATGNASRAQTQAEIAHNAYLRSFYGDQDSRGQAADDAYYAAEEARGEAESAESKLQSGRVGVKNNASRARAAADEAEADAERARSNADSN